MNLRTISKYTDSRNLLDIGCGSSSKTMPFSFFIKSLGYGIGLDNQITEHGEYVHGDMRRIPFKDDSFEVVTCMEAMEHLNDSHEKTLMEIKRILKKNGIFLFTTPSNGITYGIVWRIWKLLFRDKRFSHHKVFYKPMTWGRMIAKHFSILEARNILCLNFMVVGKK